MVMIVYLGRAFVPGKVPGNAGLIWSPCHGVEGLGEVGSWLVYNKSDVSEYLREDRYRLIYVVLRYN